MSMAHDTRPPGRSSRALSRRIAAMSGAEMCSSVNVLETMSTLDAGIPVARASHGAT